MKSPMLLLGIWLLMLACSSQVAEKPAYNFTQRGKASYYANSLAGNRTASGEVYHPDSLTAAHRHLPFGTKVQVINPATKQEVTVTINDRGPYHASRIIDLSRAAAQQIGIIQAGVAPVTVKAILSTEVADSLRTIMIDDE
ncbi:septal ring lytic transglycosylase RlpA family protein [Tunicatimonas pelagia]|uniref:septal ring lytic transglycosylase RlpA family protein n=1 Tax=Tunicatimonas pelagia TaxID=931531 RepID=UPI00266590AA|nr:septal ring lytic transglycosylase RlpA family protein [Tunicatimonas pelagia]WKN41552.1 septal ring lytic transglycosylase RlpA family protein [Tunicatimonas pelagia]